MWQHEPQTQPSSLRKQGPMRRALSIGCRAWVPALRPLCGLGRDDAEVLHGIQKHPLTPAHSPASCLGSAKFAPAIALTSYLPKSWAMFTLEARAVPFQPPSPAPRVGAELAAKVLKARGLCVGRGRATG